MKWRRSVYGHDAIGILCVQCVELNGEDLSCYSNKIESVSLRKCPHDHWLTNKAYLSAITVTNHFSEFLPTRWRPKSTRIDKEQNYVTVILCISCWTSETTLTRQANLLVIHEIVSSFGVDASSLATDVWLANDDVTEVALKPRRSPAWRKHTRWADYTQKAVAKCIRIAEPDLQSRALFDSNIWTCFYSNGSDNLHLRCRTDQSIIFTRWRNHTFAR